MPGALNLDHMASVAEPQLLLALCVLGFLPLPLWCWIRLRGSAASAWGTSTPPRAAAEASRDGTRGPCGDGCLALLAVVTAAVWSIRSLAALFPAALFQFLACWSIPILLVLVAWCRIGRPHAVPLNLLAHFLLYGGVLGSSFALISKFCIYHFFLLVSPDCNLEAFQLRERCVELSVLMWIAFSGLVEETSKAIWLFYRLRRYSNELPARCCCLFPSSGCGGINCACWFLLAPTPYHVILCALSAGAGFEIVENLVYVFSKKSLYDAHPLFHAERADLLRLSDSMMHIACTGLIGVGLARKLFPQPVLGRTSPSLMEVLVPSIVLHGLYDFFSMLILFFFDKLPADEWHMNDIDWVTTGKMHLALGKLHWCLIICISGQVQVIFTTFHLLCRGGGCKLCPPRACRRRDFWFEDARGGQIALLDH